MDSPRSELPATDVDLEQYHGKVRWLATRLVRRYRLKPELTEDLVGAGFTALYDRSKHQNYDPQIGPFWAFVEPGIEGAMWTEVQRNGISRNAYAFYRASSAASATALTADDKPTDRELIQDIFMIAENTRLGVRLFKNPPPPRAVASRTPEELVASSEEWEQIEAAVTTLPERERELIQLFRQGRTQAAIGAHFGISESRVNHILRDAMNTLRRKLGVNGS